MNKDLINIAQQSIAEIMNKNVITVSVDDSISDVEKFITEHQLSFLPVMDIDNKCFGVVSDRDFVKFHHYKGNAKLEHIWEICSHSVITVDIDTTINEAAQLLIAHKVHHLIVFENNNVTGVVSSIDLLRYYVND
ncbi:hypothetical protein tinsulaeT_26850 [Thalassotalea insulae]|uniref:CBS domain-containing protein n=1 Tax=Thalassotalea insulae TaxID=2056778 RepID=A0ABQ6GXV1_9GAMM|nr:CBS domain-containing protein [Thalassotalea insulae]GLX79345.1 hypothetical protein tinsulaeT_26850 [Thalassotalea insulae]